MVLRPPWAEEEEEDVGAEVLCASGEAVEEQVDIS